MSKHGQNTHSHQCEWFISRDRIVLCLYIAFPSSQYYMGSNPRSSHIKQLGSAACIRQNDKAPWMRIFFWQDKPGLREVGAIPQSFFFLFSVSNSPQSHALSLRDSPVKQPILYSNRGSLLMTLSSLCQFYVLSSNRRFYGGHAIPWRENFLYILLERYNIWRWEGRGGIKECVGVGAGELETHMTSYPLYYSHVIP